MQRSLCHSPGACRSRSTDVPETGRHVDLVADRATRDAIAKLAGVAALSAARSAFRSSTRSRPRWPARGRQVSAHGRSDLRGDARADRERDRRSGRRRFRCRSRTHAGCEIACDAHAIGRTRPPEPLRDGRRRSRRARDRIPAPRDRSLSAQAGRRVRCRRRTGDPASHPFAALAALKKRDNGQNREARSVLDRFEMQLKALATGASPGRQAIVASSPGRFRRTRILGVNHRRSRSIHAPEGPHRARRHGRRPRPVGGRSRRRTGAGAASRHRIHPVRRPGADRAAARTRTRSSRRPAASSTPTSPCGWTTSRARRCATAAGNPRCGSPSTRSRRARPTSPSRPAIPAR